MEVERSPMVLDIIIVEDNSMHNCEHGFGWFWWDGRRAFTSVSAGEPGRLSHFDQIMNRICEISSVDGGIAHRWNS